MRGVKRLMTLLSDALIYSAVELDKRFNTPAARRPMAKVEELPVDVEIPDNMMDVVYLDLYKFGNIYCRLHEALRVLDSINVLNVKYVVRSSQLCN